jgi:hypothetical protein
MTWIMKFAGKTLFWRLISLAGWLGSRAFKGTWDAKTHALKSRQWFWDNAFKPFKSRTDSSPNKIDDSAEDFSYWFLQMGCVDPEGPVRLKVAGILSALGSGDVAYASVLASRLAEDLGITLVPVSKEQAGIDEAAPKDDPRQPDL